MVLTPTLMEELRLWQAGCRVVAGLDEAGRGAWAGPIVAAAVVLSPQESAPPALSRVRDSKMLLPKAREGLYEAIRATALHVGVGVMPPDLIDAIGINGANRLAMLAAVDDLGLPVDHLLIDFLRLPALPTPQTPLVDGDSFCFSIAAASIVAKVTRDRLLCKLDAQYPGYSFAQHKGYGTRLHRQALQDLGVSPMHRLSFSPMCEMVGWPRERGRRVRT
ncbi:MAG: ribonuclease HII [Chloroflexota bacterium]